ncbi:hypothetical protein VTJ49DRAFT_2642 [Mycothermus thermophilus]|uniref:Uncharacterized protein n=1 Tax=Humicola insolens TaxID=85995 RepID=A0ABR3V9S5_HUMIN
MPGVNHPAHQSGTMESLDPVLAAMMDDLGIGRVDQLPLDEGRSGARDDHRGHSNSHNSHHGAARNRSAGTAGPAAPGLWSAWNEAIAAGEFNDDDAEAVKGLDDLGGGRIYQNTASQVAANTFKILNHQKKSRGKQSKQTAPSNNVPRNPPPVVRKFASLAPSANLSSTDIVRPKKSPAIVVRDPAGNVVDLKAFIKPPAKAVRNGAPTKAEQTKPTQHPVRTGFASTWSPMNVAEVLQLLPVQDGPDDLRSKVEHVVSNPLIAVQALLVKQGLTPLAGFISVNLELFAFIAYNKSFCKYPVSEWDDYFTENSHVLHLTFKDGESVVRGYEFVLRHEHDVEAVISTLASLRRGKSATPNPTTPTSLLEHATPQGLQTSRVNTSQVGVLVDIDGSEPASTSQVGVLIDVDGSEPISKTSGELTSETAGLLSTLEPWEPTASVDDKGTVSMSSEEVLLMARSLFQFFFFNVAGGNTMTALQLDQTADGVKQGLLAHIISETQANGHSEEVVQDIKNKFDSLFDSEVKQRLAAKQDHTEEQIGNQAKARGHVQYTADELLALRNAAASPPAFENRELVPKPGDRTPCTGIRNQMTQSQVQKSARAIKWVMGETDDPDSGSSKSAQDTGLQNSRWASGAPEIKNVNFFTGPKYEKAWSKLKYLQELPELDPDTKVDVGAEDLTDFYFPMSGVGKPRPGPPSTAQTAADSMLVTARNGSQAVTVTPSQDQMDTLSAGMARLAISPGSEKPVDQPQNPSQSQPKVRGLGASMHSSGTGLSSSGHFNFYLPQSARK